MRALSQAPNTATAVTVHSNTTPKNTLSKWNQKGNLDEYILLRLEFWLRHKS